jgi:protein NrfD
VKLLYGEEVASHTGLQSCAAVREGRGEALTGEERNRSQRPRSGAGRGDDRRAAADHRLKTPERFYNMLRIYRTSSPMSFGSYILTGFGVTSAPTALGHLMGERRRDGSRSPMRRAADMVQVPATFLGAGMSTYTAALLSATSTPVWASAPRAMAAQFGSSSMATTAAALSLCEQIADDPENCRRLDGLAAVASAGELVASAFAEKRYHEARVGEPLRKGPVGTSYKAGALALGLDVPLACHTINALSKRPNRGSRCWARWRCWPAGW